MSLQTDKLCFEMKAVGFECGQNGKSEGEICMKRTALCVMGLFVALSFLLGGCAYGGLFGWRARELPDRRPESDRVEEPAEQEDDTPSASSGGEIVINDVVPGDYTAQENTVMSGIVSGDVTVKSGVTFVCNGIVSGNVTVEKDGRFECRGTVSGAVMNEGTAVIFGIVSGGVAGSGETEIMRGAIIAGVEY